MPNYRSLVPGGFFSANPDDLSVRRSIRTNNPGALNTGTWVPAERGYVGQQNDAAGNNTAIMETPEEGVRLWRRLLERYETSLGTLTLAKILKRYTGGGEAYSSYLAFVSARAGVAPTATVTLSDAHQMLVIAKAFFHYEAGKPSPLSDAQIALGLKLDMPVALVGTPQLASSLAAAAEAEAALALSWTGPDSEAEKYLAPLRPIMKKLGHIGNKPVLYDWCAAFVTWNCRQAGYVIPDQPAGFWASMALVESWKHWAQATGQYLPKESPLVSGDILLFEWNDGDTQLDHIGIYLRSQGNVLKVAEGNKANRSGVFDRQRTSVAGIVRLA